MRRWWRPDTCDCIVRVELPDMIYVDWLQKCELHKDFTSQRLIDMVKAHNNGFNSRFGNIDLSLQQKTDIGSDKRAERQRIRLIGSGVRK